MSVSAEKVVPVNSARFIEVVVDFDALSLKAPFLLRCGALLIDYILLVSVPTVSLIIGRLLTGDDGRKLLTNEISSAGWLVMVLLALTNFIIFPMFTGQSIGKMLTGLRVVQTDGKTATLTNLLVRHLVGYPLTILTFGLGFLFSVLNSKGRALHDLISGTIVIYGQRRSKEIKG
jgi:uncharacterized RDD family membrane protein YckC